MARADKLTSRLAAYGAPQRLKELQAEQQQIYRLYPSLRPNRANGATTPTPRKRRRMSAAGRAKIAAAQKARWAKVRAEGKKK